MNKKTASIFITAMFTAVTLLSGCTSKSASETKQNSEPKVLIFAQGADPRGLDPAYVDDGESSKVMVNIYEGLLKYKEGSTEVEPSLAESYSISDDKKVYTFKLRKGVKFQDGTPFNADAVKYSIDRQLPPKATDDMPYASFTFGPVSKVEKVDDYTIKIYLKEPYTPFLANLAMSLAAPIVSPTAAQKSDGKLMENPVGTGPFKFVKWDKGQSIVLEKNQDYWGDKPKLDKVVFQFIKENSVRASKLMTGEVDAIDGVDPNDVAQIKSKGDTIFSEPGMNINYMGFNCSRAPFNDPQLREAIAHAINRDELVKYLYQGYAETAKSCMPTFIPGYNSNVEQYKYDPELAKKMLKDLGKENLKIKIITYSVPRPYNAVGQKLAESIQAYLLKIGIQASIDAYSWTDYKPKVLQGEGDIFLFGWIGDNGDPDNFLSLFDSSQIKGGLNEAKYTNLSVDKLLAQARQTPNGTERNDMYKKIQETIAKDSPWLPISSAQSMAAYSPKVKNFKIHPTGNIFFQYVDKE